MKHFLGFIMLIYSFNIFATLDESNCGDEAELHISLQKVQNLPSSCSNKSVQHYIKKLVAKNINHSRRINFVSNISKWYQQKLLDKYIEGFKASLLKKIDKVASRSFYHWQQMGGKQQNECSGELKKVLSETLTQKKASSSTSFSNSKINCYRTVDLFDFCRMKIDELLLLPPIVYLFDEYVSGLDPSNNQRFIAEICLNLQRRKEQQKNEDKLLLVQNNLLLNLLINKAELPSTVPLEQKYHQLIELMKSGDIHSPDSRKQDVFELIKFVESKRKHIFACLEQNNLKSMYLDAKKYHLPFSLQFYSNGDIFIHNQALIAQGSFKKVNKSIDYNKSILVANVVADDSLKGNLMLAKQEIDTLIKLQAINGIPRLYNFDRHQKDDDLNKYQVGLQEELYDLTLEDYLLNHQNISLRERVDLAESILLIVNDLHEKGLIHGDIKPSNILIKINLQVNSIDKVAITDFGSAKWKITDSNGGTESNFSGGTPGYVSPESIYLKNMGVKPLYKNFDSLKSVDVYALGVLLYEVLHNERPQIYSKSKQLYEKARDTGIVSKEDYEKIVGSFIIGQSQNQSESPSSIWKDNNCDKKSFEMLIISEMLSPAIKSRTNIPTALNNIKQFRKNCF